jgi:hypothetical protein
MQEELHDLQVAIERCQMQSCVAQCITCVHINLLAQALLTYVVNGSICLCLHIQSLYFDSVANTGNRHSSPSRSCPREVPEQSPRLHGSMGLGWHHLAAIYSRPQVAGSSWFWAHQTSEYCWLSRHPLQHEVAQQSPCHLSKGAGHCADGLSPPADSFSFSKEANPSLFPFPSLP